MGARDVATDETGCNPSFGGEFLNSRNLALVPVAVLVASILVTSFFDFSEVLVFNPPYVLLSLNLIFWTVATAAIAVISAKSFVRDGSLTILLLSSSILIFGISVIISAWVGNFSGDYSVAVSNPCILVASIIQVSSSFLSLKGEQEVSSSKRKALLVAVYLASVVFVVVNSIVVLLGYYPVFFALSGPTLLRQFVLGSAVLFFAVAFIIFGYQYLKSKYPSLFWYSLAITLFSIGLFSAFEVKVLGDLPTWLGRATLYTGTVYLVASLLASRQVTAGTDLAGRWAEACRSDRKQVTTFFSKMLDGFAYQKIVTDADGKPVDYVFLDVNDAFEKATGLKKEAVIGKRATQVMPGIEHDPAGWIEVYGQVALSGAPISFENYAQALGRWYRVSAYSQQKGYFVTLFEDVTKHKEVEKQVESLARFPSENPNAVFRVESSFKILYANPSSERLSGFVKTRVGESVSERWESYIKQALSENKQVRFEEKYDDLTFLFMATPVLSEGYVNIYGIDVTELRKAEEELSRSEKKYRRLFETSQDGIISRDLEGRMIDCNNAYTKLLGYSKKELQGITFEQLMPQKWHDQREKVVKQVLDVGGSILFEREYIRKDGSVFPASVRTWRLTDDKGKPVGVWSIVRDITERKNTENQLKETRDYFENLLNYANAPIIVWDTEFRITMFNHAFERLTGLSAKDAMGKRLGMLFPEDRKKEAMAHIKDALKGEYWESVEIPILHKNGIAKTLLWNSANITGPDGKSVIATIAQGQDITDRKKAEAKLEEYANNLEGLIEDRTKELALSSLYARRLLEASLDPLVTINPEGKITDVNEATVQATGSSREQLIGSDFSEYFTEPEKAKAGYRQVFTEGFVKDYPLAIRHKSGKITDVLYNAALYRNEVGEIQGVFAAARDITELKKAEARAQESAKKLQEVERLAAIGATAGMVGHDIRNPLQAITGDVYLLKSDLASMPDGKTKENVAESLVGIEKNVEYINKIVQDLQDFARPINPVAKKINLQDLCEDVLLKSGIPKNVRSSCKVYKNAKQVMADPELLRRVVSNLISNAVQAMPKGGKLAIRANHDESDTIIEVQDTGVGIPESAKPRLFTPLFTTKSKGQGFGLAVVKRVTESMNGSVTFESREGKGTTFTIRLPSPKKK